MRRWSLGVAAAGLAGAVALVIWNQSGFHPDRLLAAYHAHAQVAGLQIVYPFNDTLFPPESIPPTFRWKDTSGAAAGWLIAFEFPDGREPLFFSAVGTTWKAPTEVWETIKRRSRGGKAKAIILGLTTGWRTRTASAGALSFGTSEDEVGAPIFHRDVNLPFASAIKDPSQIRWPCQFLPRDRLRGRRPESCRG